ncbi:hypothetical protein LguiA_018377 [Lonicera macranthoides]
MNQGCDASVLLDGSARGPGEQEALPNLTLRPGAFRIIDDLRHRAQEECGRIVSCADIVALAARDAVYLSGGPDYNIPLGRRDSLNFATVNETVANLPSPTSNANEILTSLANLNFDPTDVVALFGGPHYGQDLCQQPHGSLPPGNTTNTTVLDIRSPNAFDNKYYVDLMNRQGLFTSDQDLYTYRGTRGIVTSFAVNQTLFFEKFVFAMIKMGQLNVSIGTQGEIRGNCSARNFGISTTLSILEEEQKGRSEF